MHTTSGKYWKMGYKKEPVISFLQNIWCTLISKKKYAHDYHQDGKQKESIGYYTEIHSEMYQSFQHRRTGRKKTLKFAQNRFL